MEPSSKTMAKNLFTPDLEFRLPPNNTVTQQLLPNGMANMLVMFI